MNPAQDRPANRLASEKSPYLQQHAHNPVDWRPWGPEAFAAAKEQDKPIFLSIGYSTCHWCHVMERESFEDEGVARILNEVFICIKVDREERPDVDAMYMTVCQMMTGRGGWPLNVVLTPDLQPFFAGTYFPKESRGSQLGMLELAAKVQDLWMGRRQDILQSAGQIVEALRAQEQPASERGLDDTELAAAEEQLAERYDALWGGFGDAPKFPTPHHLLFLLRRGRSTGHERCFGMARKTLDAMRAGGMYDHLGYGFHRYSTDAHWLLPHFEKMLYDQAQLVMAYAEAWKATGRDAYRETAREVMEYVLRDLRHPDGGFYSAEDADSEGEEGKFYLWSEQEVRSLLGKESAVFIAAYGLTAHGNYHDEATHQHTGVNILHLSRPVEQLANGWQVPPPVLEGLLGQQRSVLLAARDNRVRPHLDDKVLTDWNGLMIAAMAYAGRMFGEQQWTAAAAQAAEFVENRMVRDGRLLHRFRDGEAAIPAMLNDYAFYIWGLIELFEATLEPRWLSLAMSHLEAMNKHFWDDANGGYFVSADDAEKLLVRQKDFFDAALPAGNSVAMQALITLSRLTGRPELAERAQIISRAAGAQAGKYPSGFTQLLCAVALELEPSTEVVITGRKGSPDTQALLEIVRGIYDPGLTLLLREPDDSLLPELAAFTAGLELVDGKAAAYVCRDNACQRPVTEPEALQALLAGKSEGPA